MSCQENPRNLAQKVRSKTVNKTGTSGERPNLITASPKIINRTARIMRDSVNETFFFIKTPPNKKSR